MQILHGEALVKPVLVEIQRRQKDMEEQGRMVAEAEPLSQAEETPFAEENEVYLMGRLTNRPKIRSVEDKYKMAKFILAVNRTFRDTAIARRRETAFVPVVVWGALAQQVEPLGKGSTVRIAGRLKTWQADEKKYRWEVQAATLEVLDRRVAVATEAQGELIPE